MKKTFFTLFNMDKGSCYFSDSLTDVVNVCDMLSPYTGVSVVYDTLFKHFFFDKNELFEFGCIQIQMCEKECEEK